MPPSHYKTYQTSARQSMTALEATALLLDTAAQHMRQAGVAIEANNIEQRFKESEKVLLILGGLEQALVRTNEAISQVVQTLKDYYEDMMTLVTRVNSKNDPQIAYSIADSLQSMANEFRKVNTLHEQKMRDDASKDIPMRALSQRL